MKDFAGGRVPDDYGVAAAGCCDHFAIRRNCDRADRVANVRHQAASEIGIDDRECRVRPAGLARLDGSRELSELFLRDQAEMIESLLLSGFGVALGLMAAYGILPLIRALEIRGIPRLAEADLNPWVVGFAVSIAVLTSKRFLSTKPSRPQLSNLRQWEKNFPTFLLSICRISDGSSHVQ